MSRLAVSIAAAACALSALAASPAHGGDAPAASSPPVDRRVIDNLRAFARLYGYVRYFHPSDEAAATDWDAFAVHGAARVAHARDASALQSALLELFTPIAPTVVVAAADEPWPPLHPALTPASTEALEPVAWQHLGHGMSAEAGPYRSKRTARAQPLTAGRDIRVALQAQAPRLARGVAVLFVGVALTGLLVWVVASRRLRVPHMWWATVALLGAGVVLSVAFLMLGAVRAHLEGDLFPARSEPDDVHEAELGHGVRARVPLALWSAAGQTRPDSRAAAAELARTLAALPGTADASVEEVRLGAVIIAWNALQHFYPYFDVVEADWDDVLTDALAGARAAGTARGLHDTLVSLVERLGDGQARVELTADRAATGYVPWRLDVAERRMVVTSSEAHGIERGDIVLRIDDREAHALLAETEARVSGSPQWKRARALLELAAGEPGSQALVVVERADGEHHVRAARSLRGPLRIAEHARDPVTELDAGVWYVDLDRASMRQIRAHLDAIAEGPGVVFDLRGHPNRNHAILSHLLDEPDVSEDWMRIPEIAYPNRDRIGWQAQGWRLPVRRPHIGGSVAFITGGMAIGYAESVLGFVERYRLGEIVGGPTAGANGDITTVTLPGGYRVRWTGMRVVKHDGSRHHLVGVQPTIPVARTVAGIRRGRDELLEAALEAVGAGRQSAGSRP